ncbi:MAG: hypothetical protein HKN76_03870 [Saprospiraceae bacterium]|nr:hypothetical protein [Saprospiraceae bacterium]
MKDKISAWIAGVGWGISIYVTLINGESVFEFLRYVSQTDFIYHPMLDYWGKLTGMAFTFIGLGFVFIAVRGGKYPELKKYFAWFQIICFVGVLMAALRIDLNSQIYYLDFLFFLGTGIPMLLTSR